MLPVPTTIVGFFLNPLGRVLSGLLGGAITGEILSLVGSLLVIVVVTILACWAA